LPRRATNAPQLDKARLLALLAEHPGATKRDLARLTGLKGSDRITLKRLLRELEAEGAIEGKARRPDQSGRVTRDRGAGNHRHRCRRRIAGAAARVGEQ